MAKEVSEGQVGTWEMPLEVEAMNLRLAATHSGL